MGDKECHKTSSQKTSSITKPTATQAAPTYSNTKPFAVAWSDGVGNWAACTKVGMVFGVRVCVSKKAWQSRPKIDHIVNVLAQLLDNDEDGVVDDQAVVNFMVQQNLYLLVLASESEDVEPTIGNGQMTGTWFVAVCGSVCVCVCVCVLEQFKCFKFMFGSGRVVYGPGDTWKETHTTET